MNINGLSLPSTPPPTLDAPHLGGPATIQNRLREIGLTLVGPSGKIDGPGGEIRLRLENPTIGLADVPLTEFLQQLDSLAKTPAQVFVLGETVKQLTGASSDLAKGIKAAQARGEKPDPAVVADYSTQIERQAGIVERSLRDIIENSTYPNFSDFLKDMVEIAQKLRESATKTKLAAIESNYGVLMQAADQMLIAANEAKESRDKQIEAQRTEAIGQIVSGVVSGIVGGIFAYGGATQLGGAMSQVTSSIITSSFSLASANQKADGSVAQLKSDLANTAKTRLEAAAKLIEAEVQVADDIHEIAKGLRDMALKLFQDFISAQAQTVQRANV